MYLYEMYKDGERSIVKMLDFLKTKNIDGYGRNSICAKITSMARDVYEEDLVLDDLTE